MTILSSGQAPLIPTCPLCHTLDHTISAASLAAGAAWVCGKCGATWSETRLRTVAGYEGFVAGRIH